MRKMEFSCVCANCGAEILCKTVTRMSDLPKARELDDHARSAGWVVIGINSGQTVHLCPPCKHTDISTFRKNAANR